MVATVGTGRSGSVVLVVARVVIGGATGGAVVVLATVDISVVFVRALGGSGTGGVTGAGESASVVLATVGISVVVVLAIGRSGTGEATVAGGAASPETNAPVAWRLQAASRISSTTAQGPPPG